MNTHEELYYGYSTTRKRTIHDVLRQNNVLSDSSDDDECNENCAASKCIQSDAENISWVECFSCNMWFHVHCVGLSSKSEDDLKKIEFRCPECLKMLTNLKYIMWQKVAT